MSAGGCERWCRCIEGDRDEQTEEVAGQEKDHHSEVWQGLDTKSVVCRRHDGGRSRCIQKD